MRFSVIHLFVSTLCLMTSAALALSLAKPGCQETCGNVTIPYPFGIGSQCYLKSSFAVICENSTNPARLFLRSMRLEILNMSLYGTVRVVQPVLALNCSDELKTQYLGKSLVGSPFTISALQNSLTVLGCRNSVWLRANRTTTNGGCMAICDDNSTDTSCNGINCCKITIPTELKELQFTYQSIRKGRNKSFCGYAFLADKKWFREDYRKYNGLRSDLQDPFDQEFGNASMVLEWEYDDALEYSDGTDCVYPNERSFSYSSLYFELSSRVCYCLDGFEGNPYLPEGCQDIDECGNSTICPHGFTCTNTMGSYYCQKQKSRQKIVFIVIGCALGALGLLLGAWASTKAIRKRIKAHKTQVL
ncbi:UNVERIFIED_CONTAM: Wall-associated receptor kinase-like 8 [Sesamum radiatum]|uniref:Wall-associated receptor kinase-like 8 n=1 Tax=Sesamum radiatum TaxID=300843 RepID=A0AAW2V5J4_SESRA